MRQGDEGAGHVERVLGAMGTSLVVEVWAPTRPEALAASEAAVRAIARVEERLSTWNEDSELSALNRTPVGEPFRLSEDLARDLLRVRELWRATGGAFDPSVGALVGTYGLRSGGRTPTEAELEEARSGVGFGALWIQGRTAIRTNPGLRLEEGGFGKGVGLDAGLFALDTAGATRARIDLGGQVALFGTGLRDEPLVLALADPRDRTRGVLELELHSGSLATSGNSERGITVAGERRSHILDPRAGVPAQDFGSVTVWAPDAIDADALSTALFVLGPAEALSFASATDRELEVIVIETPPAEGGPLLATLTPGWEGHVRALVPDLELRFSPRPPVEETLHEPKR